MAVDLYDHQLEALDKLRSGSILCGGVGSGKSRTAIAYFFQKECNGNFTKEAFGLKDPKDLYIITTARKRDTLEWDKECACFGLGKNRDESYKGIKVTIDSWNNVAKYTGVKNAFFIFDEQRAVGSGTWAKSLIKIARFNHWIMLSATPGDTWMDYISVFVANGFYRNRTAFIVDHVIYDRFAKYPKISGYRNTEILEKLRSQIIVNMPYVRPTRSHHEYVFVEYDKQLYKSVSKIRMNPYTNEPIGDAGGLCYVLRQICNSDTNRASKCVDICRDRKKAIVFYNFDYELDILRNALTAEGITFAEWNGHKHEPIPNNPDTSDWVYLVQYTAGAEGWNCIDTDTIIFYSANFSYKIMVQAAGRIDRLNTKFVDLYYYHLMSSSQIDYAIKAAIEKKEDFNEKMFVGQ